MDDDVELSPQVVAALYGVIQAAVRGDDEAELARKTEAVLDNLQQMRDRSGPQYELSQQRSRIVADAYRAAGSPRHVSKVRTPTGWEYRHIVTRGPRRGELEPATEEDWRAWHAWAGIRFQLRAELRRRDG
jgi:hypothetical protein